MLARSRRGRKHRLPLLLRTVLGQFEVKSMERSMNDRREHDADKGNECKSTEECVGSGEDFPTVCAER